MKKSIIVGLLIISTVFFLCSCKSSQEKYEGSLQIGIEELNNQNFDKSAKYFRKAEKSYSGQDFDGVLIKELKIWWNNYIESDEFKGTLLEDEPRNKINDVRIAFINLLDGENEIYDVFISNVHFFKGKKLTEIDRKENVKEAIDEFVAVLEVDENYDTARQELTWLEQDRNRWICACANDMNVAILSKDFELAERQIAEVKKFLYDDETETIDRMKKDLENAKKEKDLYTLEEFINAYNNLPNVVPDLFGSLTKSTYIDVNNYNSKEYSEKTNDTNYTYYTDSVAKQPLLTLSVNENNKVVSVYLVCTSSDYFDDSLQFNPLYKVIYLLEEEKTMEQVNTVVGNMFMASPNMVKSTWTYQHLRHTGDVKGFYVETFAIYSDLYLEQNPNLTKK